MKIKVLQMALLLAAIVGPASASAGFVSNALAKESEAASKRSPAADTFSRVRDNLVKLLEVSAEKVTEKALLIDDLGADDLELSEIAMIMKDEFGVVIADGAMDDILTVADLVKYINDLLGDQFNNLSDD